MGDQMKRVAIKICVAMAGKRKFMLESGFQGWKKRLRVEDEKEMRCLGIVQIKSTFLLFNSFRLWKKKIISL